MKTTFYMVRHGQPDWGWAETMRFFGPCSAYMPLTPLGVEQIERTACDPQLRGAAFILACMPSAVYRAWAKQPLFIKWPTKWPQLGNTFYFSVWSKAALKW